MPKQTGYQDIFLNYARREHVPVTLFLINGFQIKGTVRGFDSFTVVMDSEGRQQLIYKHAISTVMPAKPIPLEAEINEEE